MRLILATALTSLLIISACSQPGQLMLPDQPDGQRVSAGDFIGMSPDCCWELATVDNQLAGSVAMRNTSELLYIRITTDSAFPLESLDLYAGRELPGKGNPARFPYREEFSPALHEYTFEVPISDLPAECPLYIAVHAMVRDGKKRRQAWGCHWNDGEPGWDFSWKRDGGGICAALLPVPEIPDDVLDI